MLIELLPAGVAVRRGLGVRRSGVTQRFRIPSRRVWARVSAYGVSYRGTGVLERCTKLRYLPLIYLDGTTQSTQPSARRAQQHEQILGTHRPPRARTRRGGRVRDRAVSGVVLECLLLPAVRCCQEATSLMYRADGAAAGTVVPYVSLAVAYP